MTTITIPDDVYEALREKAERVGINAEIIIVAVLLRYVNKEAATPSAVPSVQARAQRPVHTEDAVPGYVPRWYVCLWRYHGLVRNAGKPRALGHGNATIAYRVSQAGLVTLARNGDQYVVMPTDEGTRLYKALDTADPTSDDVTVILKHYRSISRTTMTDAKLTESLRALKHGQNAANVSGDTAAVLMRAVQNKPGSPVNVLADYAGYTRNKAQHVLRALVKDGKLTKHIGAGGVYTYDLPAEKT
jgi:hypothetical protein